MAVFNIRATATTSFTVDLRIEAESEEEAIEMAQDELRWASPSDYEGVYETENDVEIDDVEETEED